MNNTEIKVKKRRCDVVGKEKTMSKQLRVAIKRVDDLSIQLSGKKNSKSTVKDEIEKLKRDVRKLDFSEDSNDFDKILSNMRDDVAKKVICGRYEYFMVLYLLLSKKLISVIIIIIKAYILRNITCNVHGNK